MSLNAQYQQDAHTARWQGGVGMIVARSSAGLALLSAAIHLIMPFIHHEAYLTWLMVALSLLCIWCAFHLWTGPTRRTWWLTAGMYSLMLVLHGIISWSTPSSGQAHHHMEMTGPIPHHLLMNSATVVSVALVVLAIWALRRTSRMRKGGESAPSR